MENPSWRNPLFFYFEQLLHSKFFAKCCVEATKHVAEVGSVV